MAAGKCKECGGQVASSAKACPHCGAKVPKKVAALGWLFVLLVIFPLGWWLGSNSDRVERTFLSIAGAESAAATAFTAEEIHKQCSEYAGLAKVIMEKRQAEVSVASLMEAVDDEDVHNLILAAYERRAYRTAENQDREISMFQNAAYLSCTKGAR